MKTRTIPDWPNYRISEGGVLIRKKDGFRPKYFQDDDGYLRVSVSKGKRCKIRGVHQLVAEAWLRPSTSTKKTQVNHIDGDKQNNHWRNLEWVTSRQNTHHAIATGLRKTGQALTEKKVLAIRHWVVAGKRTIASAARKFGGSERNIHDIVYGRIWKDVGGPTLKGDTVLFYKGRFNNDRKLTDVSARNIRIRVKKGSTIAEEARNYNVGESTIRRIVFGWSYENAGGPIRTKPMPRTNTAGGKRQCQPFN